MGKSAGASGKAPPCAYAPAGRSSLCLNVTLGILQTKTKATPRGQIRKWGALVMVLITCRSSSDVSLCDIVTFLIV